MSQKTEILNYMQTHVGITPIEALDKFHCFRLAARISDLRSDGHKSQTIKHGEQHYAEYRLEKS